MGITKNEIKAIFGIAIFGVLWMIVISDYVTKSTLFKAQSPPIQYLLFNLGYISISIVIFGILFSIMRKKEGLINLIINGLAGYLLFAFVFDLWSPPYAYSMSGVALQDISGNGSAYITTSSDYIAGWFWQQLGFASDHYFIGISQIYLLVYIATPIIVVIGVALVLEPSGTVAFIRGGFSNSDNNFVGRTQ